MSLSPEILDRLRAIVGASHVRTGELAAALDPGRHPDNLKADVVVAPATTAEVAAVMTFCHAERIGVVPHGGRTGLVGGGISHVGEIVLALTRMASIVRFDPIERTAVVEAGITLQALQEAAAEHGLEPGIDLAARGSATIGGMVSTNAGGVMAFRNGVMRHRVLGLEAVLADGSVYSDLSRVVKNTAGYDLKHLFIGGEGTLGIVTKVVVALNPLPRATATALFGLPSLPAALEMIGDALATDVGHMRAAEVMWQGFIRHTAGAHGWSEPSLPLDQPLYLIVSLGGGREGALRESLEEIFAQTLERYPTATGIIASSARQEADLWSLREDTDAVYHTYKAAPSYDVSVPLSAIEGYVESVNTGMAAIDPALVPFLFGHLGDGNLHIILNHAGPLPPDKAEAVEDLLYRDLRALGGSFSAEHGVGSKRMHSLLATADATKIATMRRVKQALDPDTLLNAGKVVPQT